VPFKRVLHNSNSAFNKLLIAAPGRPALWAGSSNNVFMITFLGGTMNLECGTNMNQLSSLTVEDVEDPYL
jgi:hypothetical protein